MFPIHEINLTISCRAFSNTQNVLLNCTLLESPYLIEFIHPIFIEAVRLFADKTLAILYGEIPVSSNPSDDLKAESIAIASHNLGEDVHLGYFHSSRPGENYKCKEIKDFLKLVTEGRDAIFKYGTLMREENLGDAC